MGRTVGWLSRLLVSFRSADFTVRSISKNSDNAGDSPISLSPSDSLIKSRLICKEFLEKNNIANKNIPFSFFTSFTNFQKFGWFSGNLFICSFSHFVIDIWFFISFLVFLVYYWYIWYLVYIFGIIFLAFF